MVRLCKLTNKRYKNLCNLPIAFLKKLCYNKTIKDTLKLWLLKGSTVMEKNLWEICITYFDEGPREDEKDFVDQIEEILAEIEEKNVDEAAINRELEALFETVDKDSDTYKAIARAVEWFKNEYGKEEEKYFDEERKQYAYEDADGCRSYHGWIALLNH